jgi:serine protease AprX
MSVARLMPMRKSSLLSTLAITAYLVATAGGPVSAQLGLLNAPPKLDSPSQRRATVAGHSRVIVRASTSGAVDLLPSVVHMFGGAVGRSLPIIDSIVVDLPNGALAALAGHVLVSRISLDRPVAGVMERTGATIGATAVRQELGYDGTGIGVAVIDSGTASHDDLLDPATGETRVDAFVDFVNGRQDLYDDYGHGTHVAGIVAGNGFDSGGARTGIAPAAHIVSLKTLDADGRGRVSDVIAALDYAVHHRNALNIRVINMSIASAVYESYETDPLTVAARKAVNAGIVVVAAAGNSGRDVDGHRVYGAITAPGNAPWVLTVGASSHMGTIDRGDDTVAAFSSRGPTLIDAAAKPDLVAPGVGLESLSNPESAFYATRASALLSGTVATPALPYLSLSGTSMAAPVVSGTIALMLQANPDLTPEQVKAILQYTAQPYAAYDILTQGAGFLDARAAVEIAQSLVGAPSTDYPALPDWSSAIVSLADSVFTGGGVVVGTSDGDTVVWGTGDGDTVVWGTGDGDTVVWGTSCGDPSCNAVVWDRP